MTTQANKLVTFRLGDDLFAANVHDVERVLRYAAPTAVPNMPSYIEGVMDYRGQVVPVINMRRRIELPDREAQADTRMLVFNAGNELVAGVVDTVTEVTAFDPANVSPPPPLFRGLAAKYLRGTVRVGEKLLIYLDVQYLLSSTERIALQSAGAEVLSHV